MKKQRWCAQLHHARRPNRCLGCKNGFEGVVFPGQRDFSKKSSDRQRGGVSQPEGPAKCNGLEVSGQPAGFRSARRGAGGVELKLDLKRESRAGTGTRTPPEMGASLGGP